MNGAPGARRNFIDGCAGRLYAGHLPGLSRYRKILARRNSLLATREPSITAQLEPWDEQLATTGAELIARRGKAAAMLQTELGRVFPALSGERHKVEIRYRTAVGEATSAADLLEASLGRVEQNCGGGSRSCPHRDDLAIEHDGVDVRAFGRLASRALALPPLVRAVLPLPSCRHSAILLIRRCVVGAGRAGVANVMREIQSGSRCSSRRRTRC